GVRAERLLYHDHAVNHDHTGGRCLAIYAVREIKLTRAAVAPIAGPRRTRGAGGEARMVRVAAVGDHGRELGGQPSAPRPRRALSGPGAGGRGLGRVPTAATARARTALNKTMMAPARMLIVSGINAAACRMRSGLEATCSQTG